MRYFLIVLLLASAGCAAYERSREATQAQSRMLGLRDDQVRQCAGPPSTVERRGDSEIWVYQSGGEDVRRDTTPTGFGRGETGLSPGADPLPKRNCTIRLTMRNQRVTRVNYYGVTGGVFSQGEQCAFIVANCLR